MMDGRQIVRCPGCNAEVVATDGKIQHHVHIRRIPHEEAVRRRLDELVVLAEDQPGLYATDADGHLVWQERVKCSGTTRA